MTTAPEVAVRGSALEATPDAGHRRGGPVAASLMPMLAAAAFTTFFIPQRYAVGSNGFSFASSTVFGLLGLLSWFSALLFVRRAPSARFNAVRIALLLYLTSGLYSVGVAYSRPLDALEAQATLRSFVVMAGLVGLALAFCDGVRTMDQLRTVLHWLLLGGYVSGLVAMGQKFIGLKYIAWWGSIPGLHNSRGGVATLLSGRTVGTADHPIEFSVVCACLVGLAVIQARYSATRSKALLHRGGAILLTFSSLLGVSRSGFICLAIIFVGIMVTSQARTRVNILALMVLTFGAVQVLSRGTLATLQYQLSHIGSDNSSLGRLDDYAHAFDLISQRPLNGLGLGTYNPKIYGYLDNSWLGKLLSGGLIGVAALALLILAALYTVGSVKRRMPKDSYTCVIARGLGFSLFALAIAAYFFDEFSFTQVSAMFFIVVGALGATRTISADDEPINTPT